MGLRYATPAEGHYDYPLHVGQLLRSALETRSGQSILGSDGRRHDYPEFGRRVHRLANVLTALGVAPGDVVAVMDWDSHRYQECYFAIPMLGAVLQTVNVRLSPEQIAYTLRDTGARVVLFHADFAALVAQLATQLPQLERFVLTHAGQPPASLPLAVAGEYEALLAAAEDRHAFVDIDERALATTFHTTGTTGDPKAVAFSHRQLVLHTLAVGTTLGTQPEGQGLRHGDVYMPVTPMFHVHAWGLPYLATLLGLKQVYPGRYVPAQLLRLRRQEGVTFSHCVPTILQMLLDAFGPEDPVDRRWTIIVGGSVQPRALHRAAAAKGITALSGYGMSETAPVLSIARSFAPPGAQRETELCSAGHPVPLAQLRVVDPDMQTLPADGQHQGELVARTPWLTASYGGNAQAGEALWRGGWLHTQDVASIAADGRLVIRDRLKDVIKTGGEWVSSAEMEDLTVAGPGICAASYVGVADPRWGERPVVFVVPAEGAQVSLEGVRAHLQQHVDSGAISRYALPDELIVVEELPRTSVGKIDKKALRARLAQRDTFQRD
ncbi:long-chain-fatty-acid--CoA ligase [Pseudoxanthomonas sp. USHLN014]|uniref:long-chain-fatty-acid--CoA ligase n=1 Tax=Pseudoxanthomonas sp. USHLN014 TaxID=3081297 RepID=UPI00301CD752